MTIEAFNVLVERGYVTNVGFVNHYRGNPELLESKSIEDLAGEGVISKMCADFVVDDTDTGEEVIIEKIQDNDADFTPPTEKDDETITPTPEPDPNPIAPTDDDIVVDDENPTIVEVVDDSVEGEDPIDEDVEE